MDEFFARNRLSAYLDGELAPAEAREVESALAQSPALRAEYDALRHAVELLHVHGPVPAPAGFADRLDRRLAAEPMPSGWRRAVGRLRMDVVMVAAAAAVVLYVSARPKEDAAPMAEVAAPEALATAEAPPAIDTAPAANGLLGDEAGFKPPSLGAASKPEKVEQKKLPSRKVSANKQEKEPHYAEWEQTSEPPLAAAPTVYATGAIRYRLEPNSDSALRQLDEVARKLGGRLTDASGRPIAPYQMESGTVKEVRVAVPANKAPQLQAHLESMGVVQALSSPEHTLYASGAEVPIAIEVHQP